MPDMRTALRELVLSLGCEEVFTAKDGDQGIAIMKQHKFDLVLCDYNLGDGKDGQQILEEVRHRGLLPLTSCFIMVTAENTSPMVMAALEYVPDDYLSKPVPKALFKTRLRRVLEKKESLRAVLMAVQSANYRKALSLCEQQITTDQANRADLIRIKGEMLLALGEYSKAERLYQNILDERPLTWAAQGKAETLFKQQRYRETVLLLRKQISMDPSQAVTFDFLAQAFAAMGLHTEAQDALAKAIERSPKSLLRQRRFADVAYGNNDFSVAEQAYRAAIRIGKGSCFRGPSEFFGLAKSLVKLGNGAEALRVLEALAREFYENEETGLLVPVVESMAFGSLGAAEKSIAAVERALAIMIHTNLEQISTNTLLTLAEQCFGADKAEEAKNVLRQVLLNQCDNAVIQTQVTALCRKAGLEDGGRELTEWVAKEVARINNQGVRLALDGNLQESILFFEKAVRTLPKNVAINLNAAQSLLFYMREYGPDRANLTQVKVYLDHIQAVGDTSPKYQKLRELLNRLESEL